MRFAAHATANNCRRWLNPSPFIVTVGGRSRDKESGNGSFAFVVLDYAPGVLVVAQV
jgi:hypothetical protein